MSIESDILYEPGVEPVLTPAQVVDSLLHQLAIARDRREVETEERIMMELNEQYTIDPNCRPSVRQTS